MAQSENSGLRLLSFDGGGIRGLSSLVILRAIMYRIQAAKKLKALPRPCEYFHLIGGTSTGGLIALMLGRLRMTVDEAISAYNKLAQDVFKNTKRLDQDGTFKASRLEAAIKKIVQDYTTTKNMNEPMEDPGQEDAICRTFVCARSARNLRANTPVLFRTYKNDEESVASCAIWEAARATSAAPTLFKRIEIDTGASSEPYIDGGVGCNNPTDIVLAEAKVLIGTGQMKPASIPRPWIFQNIIPTHVARAMVALTTDCETTNQAMLKRYAGTRGVYFRFNVEQGMQDIKLAEWERLSDVTAHTTQYLKEETVKQQLAEVMNVLKEELHTNMNIC
ncbi:FabD/lysophospholipase-like protein [Mycena rosella]|uniref:FabD/lysophospholipase-like protein n=1 Tax=Mycena rosella TaxID=1033263 RepID=A0AAD7DHS6_MYCRO|nr:FabD/lysophospholipase-like protein [Mycena rosella]